MIPSKLLDIDPLWKICTQGYFTGYDPPRTLDPATAMVPKVTPPSNPSPNPGPAKPAATQGSLPKMTTTPADPMKTSSDPSLAKSHGNGGMQEDPLQKSDPSKDTKKADVPSKSHGKNDPQGQSLQEDPNSSDPKNSPIHHASSNDVANSDSDQPESNVHVSGGSSMKDGDVIYQSQPLAKSALALMTTVPGSHHVLAAVEGHKIDGVAVDPGSATDINGQQIAVESSNHPRVGGQTARIEPAESLVPTAVVNHMITTLSKGIAIQGFTLKDGGPAAIVATTTFSIDASGNIFVNGHSYRVHNASPVPTTISGEVVKPLPTGISIHSATLTPNAPALVISDTSYSLDSSRNLYLILAVRATCRPSKSPMMIRTRWLRSLVRLLSKL